ncbi:MAG: oligosaccharide flippase family protein, partial [Nitrospinae bacterium]|nr:oligosaccharide flippase family protein [Nitrospinota bacterium]
MNLAQKAIKSVFFHGIAHNLNLIYGVISSIILARLLIPEDFGKVALAVSIMEMIARLRNISIESAVIHKQSDEKRVFSTQFFLSLFLEIPFLIAVLGSRPFIIGRYTREIANIVLILAVASSLRSISLPFTTWMQKNLEYKKMALFFTLGPLISIAITLILAFQGFSVWSLVAGRVLNYIFDTIVPIILVPWRPSWDFDIEIARDIWQYCSKAIVIEILSWVMWAGDDFIVGTWLGTNALGYYTIAWNLSSLPTQKISQVVDGVAFPTYSKLQYDKLALSQAFTNFAASVIRICAFISVLLVIIAPEFITIVLGKKWLPTVTTFQLMIAYAILRPVYENAGSVF